MKIIQSFAQYVDGSPYVLLNENVIYLNFYTYLLSFLTLKKYYGSVTMYTNQLGFETIVKHIPYDEIIILENQHGIERWNLYKLQAIKKNRW